MPVRELAPAPVAPLPSVLVTKLVPPVERDGLIARPRLISALDHLSSQKLTLVSAPAGYGKTSLLTSWVSDQTDEAVAWLTADRTDDDPARFWANVAEAVELARPGAGARSSAMLRARGALPSAALNELLRDIVDAAPLAIVVDDVHVIESRECLDLLSFLLEHLPTGVRLILGSRVDPALALGRLRASGHLREIRAADLVFTTEEAGSLLVEKEGLALTEEDVTLLVERTEGWPAALYLAALWLRREDDPGAHVRGFAAGQRYVAEYLTEEMLDTLTPSTREFLVRASVFNRFCASLCDEVLGRDDARSVLEETARSNLLLVPLDEDAQWFRFHHLFDDLLELELERSEPGLAPELHARAAAWFRRQELPEEAAEHALAAGDGDLAAAILSGIWLELMRRGDAGTLLRIVERVPLESLLAHPELAAGAAQAAFQARRPTHERLRWLAVADRSRTESPDTWSALAESMSLLARATPIDGDVGAAAGYARRALELAKKTSSREGEVLARAALAHALYLQGNAAEARSHASRAMSSPEAPHRPQGVVRALGTSALLAVESGGIDEAAGLAKRAIEFATDHHFSTASSVSAAHLARGQVLVARSRLAGAEAAVTHGERLCRAPEPTVHHAHALLLLAEVRTRRGRVHEAKEALDDAKRQIRTFKDPGRLPRIAARVRRRLRAASALADESTEPLSPAEWDVLQLLATDLSQRGIGHRLFLSVNTIKTHTRSIYRKLGVTTRATAIARAYALGLIRADDSPG